MIALRWGTGRCINVIEKKRCTRAVREKGDLCTPCWMASTAMERALIEWEDDGGTPEPEYDVMAEVEAFLRDL